MPTRPPFTAYTACVALGHDRFSPLRPHYSSDRRCPNHRLIDPDLCAAFKTGERWPNVFSNESIAGEQSDHGRFKVYRNGTTSQR
jgi:hypothetical protein